MHRYSSYQRAHKYMSKTPTQEKLEAQRGGDIAQILREALEGRRDQKHMVTIAAMDLGVTDATLYQWCREFGIDIDEYRRPSATSTEER